MCIRQDTVTVSLTYCASAIGDVYARRLGEAYAGILSEIVTESTDVLDSPVEEKVSKSRVLSPAFVGTSPTSNVATPFSLLSDDVRVDVVIRHAATQCGVPEDLIEDIYPCTATQEMLIGSSSDTFCHQVTQWSFVLARDINIDRLREAWETTAQANPILRTRIVERGQDKPLQVVIRENIHWSTIRDSDNGQSLQSVKYDMNFGQGLVRLFVKPSTSGTANASLLLLAHHVVHDKPSLHLLLGNVNAAYNGTKLQPQPFSAFVQETLKAEHDGRLWEAEFAGLEATIFPSLPSATYRPSARTKRHQRVSLNNTSVDVPSPSTYISLAWAIVQSQQQGGNNDVLFGIGVSGRDGLINGLSITGPTTAILPWRVNLDLESTVEELNDKLNVKVAACAPFEQIGLQKIAESSGQAKDACSFQTLLIIHPPEKNLPPIFREQSVVLSNAASRYAVTLVVQPVGKTIQLQALFDEKVVSQTRMLRILNHFSETLKMVYDNPHWRIADCMRLGTQDFTQLALWNLNLPPTVDSCVHDVIGRHYLSRKHLPAVSSWDGGFTYGELDNLSGRLASYLTSRGIGPEVFVPLCLEKSRWTVVAMLAVMKAGGAFALLDPSHPFQRLEGICRDLKAGLIISSRKHAVFASKLTTEAIVIDSSHPCWYNGDGSWSSPTVRPQNALYAVFTSGSTGKPKGVIIEHRSYCSGAYSHIPLFNIDSNARVLQSASYAFDVSVMETLSTLMAGACVCVVTESQRTDKFAETANMFEATHALLTPSFVRSLSRDDLKSIQTIILGGERMSQSDASYWANHVHLMNAYGPAECSANSSVQSCIGPDSDLSNIGHATGGVCWIVDPRDHNRLMPIGAAGELVIEGPIVGREYLNNPSQTVAAFIEAPPWLIGLRPGMTSRLYKTGDLVRLEEDGSMCYIGRKDSQAKIRGQRIELSEVEHHVSTVFQHSPEVVVEVITPQAAQNSVLAAFVCYSHGIPNPQYQKASDPPVFMAPNEQFFEEAQKAQTRLNEMLPSYMIPTVFIPLMTVPMTKTGKTDRKLLREQVLLLSKERFDNYISGTLPKRPVSTHSERIIQKLFAQILGLSASQIGADDNFFRIGGDSIMAIKLVGRAREAGLSLSVADVMGHPRLGDLALVSQIGKCKSAKGVRPFSLLEVNRLDCLIQQVTDGCAVSAEEVEDIYPCTALQEGMMTLTAKKPGMYTGHLKYDLPDNINLDSFRAAWQATTDANPILRTRIVETEDMGWFQVVLRTPDWWIESNGSHDHVAQDLTESMGLGMPLIRFTVITSINAPVRRCFIITLHHALADGWSIPLILNQVESAYRGIKLQSNPFNEFICHTLASKNSGAFWQNQFTGLNAAVFPELPSAGYTPSPDACIEHVLSDLEISTTDYTMSTLIRLAWALVVSQYTDSCDVVFGVTVTGRNAPVAGIEAMTGPTISTVPLRVRLDRNATVRNALQSLQDQATAMIPFEQTGLQNIRKMSPEAEAACNFQSHLGVQPPNRDEKRNLFLMPSDNSGESMNYAAFSSYAFVLICTLQANKTSVLVSANYDAGIVSQVEAERIIHQFGHVLAQLCRISDQSLHCIEMVSARDLQELKLRNEVVPPPNEKCVHDLVLQWCVAQPEKTCVSSWDGTLTYAALNALSSKLAKHLLHGGVRSGVLVPLCFDKSKWAVVAMLAVLRAGGACVLIDPAHPRNRVEQIVKETAAGILIASATTYTHLEGLGTETIIVSKAFMDALPELSESLLPTVPPERPAFIIFTSGSTGKPKGIVMGHTALSTSIRDHSDGMNVDRNSRSLHFASYAFDASIYEIFTTLAAGGCLCVPSEFDRMNNLSGFICDQQVNWATLTPSSLRLLLPEDVPSLRSLVLGGEAVTQENVDTWAGKLNLINGYGPAEATICALFPLPTQGWIVGTFGHVVGGVGWITDPADSNILVAVGAVGELLVEGHVLAHGYLNDPKKTSAAFVENPAWLRHFRPGGQGRLYRTGDLVKYNDDGTIRFIGRKDTQVKLRGQRIELGEVETHILRIFEGIDEVVAEVVMPSDQNGHPFLAAFILPKKIENERSALQKGRDMQETIFAEPGPSFYRSITTLETKLRGVVPKYMVPSIFIPLTRMPKTVSGKTDRRRLREEAASLSRETLEVFSALKGEKRPPSTKTEKKLQKIWAKLLNTPLAHIGVDDSFFHIGGDSIGAMRMASMARAIGLSVVVADIFAHPELGALSQVAEKSLTKNMEINDSSFSTAQRIFCESALHDYRRVLMSAVQDKDGELPPISEVEDVLPATEVQSFLIDRYPWTHFSFCFRGQIDVSRLRDACKAVMKRHSILRTLFLDNNNGITQIILKDFDVPLQQVETDEDLETYSRRLCDANLATSVVKVRQPTAFYLISSSTPGRHIFLVRLSHAQYDGVSVPTLFNDLTAAYNGATLSTAPTFSDYLHYRSRNMCDTAFQAWRDYLEGSSMVNIKPCVPQTLAQRTAISETRDIPLSTPPKGITLATLVKAAWSLVLSQITQRADLVFGQTVNGRGLPLDGIDGILGPCVNYIPFRVTMDMSWTVLELLNHVQMQHMRTMSYDYLDLQGIVANATNWDRGTQLGSVVQHQNIETDLKLPFHGVNCSFSASGELYPSSEIWVTSTPRDHDLAIQICCSAQTMTVETAGLLADSMCTLVQFLSRYSEKPLATVFDDFGTRLSEKLSILSARVLP